MNGKMFICLFGILLSAKITLQVSSATHYVGAAVEYHPVTKGDDATKIANENAKNYKTILKKAKDHDVDIIVFPEGSLTSSHLLSTYVPDPNLRENPCKNESSTVIKALKDISCAASEYGMYVVVNVREKLKCQTQNPTCVKNSTDLYNTNVVFDRTGKVVARYRKYNLFGDSGMNKTTKPELSTFTTDFNVTFGQFICFDILFEKPALQLIRDAKVTDIVFTSMWFSELPYLSAPAVQSGWSYSNNVNFLASGYNDPSRGSGGSGLYAGIDGPLTSFWTEKRANAIVIANIPKIKDGRRDQRAVPIDPKTYVFSTKEINSIEGTEPVNQQTLLSDNLSPYTTQLLPPTNGTFASTLCDRGLCCAFSTNITHINRSNNNVKYYRYRLAVFNGVRTFSGKATGGTEICSIISCTDDTATSCNQRFDINEIIVHPVTFNSIMITGNFTTGPSVLRMPIGINTDLQPLNASDFTYVTTNINKTHANFKYSLKKNYKRLMTFAIWGRNFATDNAPVTAASSSIQSGPLVLMLVFLVISIGNIHAAVPITLNAA